MENPYTVENLQAKSYEELEDILSGLNLSTVGNKQ